MGNRGAIPTREVVVDASVLIALEQVQLPDLLPALYPQVVIPPAVAAEIQWTIPTIPSWLEVVLLAAE